MFPCLIGAELALGGLAGCCGGNAVPKRLGRPRFVGAIASAAPAFLGSTTGRQQARHTGNHSTSSKSEPTIPMIRISFDTRTGKCQGVVRVPTPPTDAKK
jgi:hypothetical protein